MKNLLFLLFFVFGASLFAQQVDTPNYNKYSVTVSAGSDLLRNPFTPQFSGGLGVGYKFTQNYNKFFDTAYGSFGYTGDLKGTRATSFHAGLMRTMLNDRDRLGFLLKVEGGTTALYKSHAVFKPSGAAGFGLAFDFSGDPYPLWMNNVSISLVPMLNKIAGVPVYWNLALGVTKSWK